MLTELPKPTKIVVCSSCGHVSDVVTDIFGQYCGTCGIPLNALKRKKIEKELSEEVDLSTYLGIDKQSSLA